MLTSYISIYRRSIAALAIAIILALLIVRADIVGSITGLELYNIYDLFGTGAELLSGTITLSDIYFRKVISFASTTVFIAITALIMVMLLPDLLGTSWRQVRRSIEVLFSADLTRVVERASRTDWARLQLRKPIGINRGIYCGKEPSEEFFGSRASLLCGDALEAEEVIIHSLMSNPLNILFASLKPRSALRLPTVIATTLLTGMILVAVMFSYMGYTVSLQDALIIAFIPAAIYWASIIISYMLATGRLRLGREKLLRIEEELPYATAYVGALLYSGLSIAKVFRHALGFKTLPEFRRSSAFILKMQLLTGSHVIDVMEKLAVVHPSQLFRVFLNTIAALEKIGGERFTAVAKLHEVFMNSLRNRIKGFTATAELLLTIAMMFFVLIPMVMVVSLFLFANILTPESFQIVSLATPILLGALLSAIITGSYIYEVSERLSPKLFVHGIAGLAIAAAAIVLPLLSGENWLSTISTGPLYDYTKALIEATGITVKQEEYIVTHSVVITVTVLALAALPLSLLSLKNYRDVETVVSSLQQLVRSISEQAKIGTRPTVAVQKAIEMGILGKMRGRAKTFYDIVRVRLAHGITLNNVLEGVEERLGFQLPKGIHRLFELLHFMESIGLEPKAIERFSDMLIEVFEMRNEVKRKVRNNLYMGIGFVVLLALLVVVVKVAVINSLESLRDIAVLMQQGTRGLPLQISPISPEKKVLALILAYYSTLLNALVLGYIAGKVLSNSIATATFYAVLAALIVGIVIIFTPLLENIIPIPTLTI